MMMSDLPSDLVEEILSRIPATTLRKLRSTCKRWNTLFKDRRFAEKHFRRAEKESMVVMLKECRVFPTTVNLNVSPPSVEFKGALKNDVSISKQIDIAEVFHCDGLLLCTTKDNRLLVWNPCLGETRRIQLKADNNNEYSFSMPMFALGYHNNESCRSYKILRFKCYLHNKTLENRDLGFEIYEFNSDSWRVLDYVAPDCSPPINVVSLKGNTYWVHMDHTSEESIVGFDFTRERLMKNLSLPPFQYSGFHVILSVVREEQLSVLHHSFGASKLEIWVTNKVDTEANSLQWSKSFVADLHTSHSLSHWLSNLFLDEEKKVALCCGFDTITSRYMVYTIGEDNEYFTQVPYIESTNNPMNPWLSFIFNYVPSLVHIQ